MNRREVIKSATAAGIALAAGRIAASAEQQSRPAGPDAGPPQRPNVLVIYADQHRIDCMGAYGNREIRTSNLDAVAADGVRFSNSFCPLHFCTPSRYSFLSGLWVHEHQAWGNHATPRPGTPMFPAIMRAAGYRTKAVGKMHFTPTYLDVGFDEMELAEQDGVGRFDDDYHRWLKGQDLADGIDLEDQRSEYRSRAPAEYWETFGARRSDLDEAHYSTTWIADRAVETVSKWTGGGNLLMVGFIKPHHPFDPPAPWDRMYDPEKMTPLAGWTDAPLPRDIEFSGGYFPHAKLTLPALKRVMAHYYATISEIDFHVGRMTDVLRRKGLYDSTMIVYTADHGEYMGFHHLLLKGNLGYDPLMKVPLIIKYPGGAARGTVSDALVSAVDLAPTILRQALCRPAEKMRGLDLAAGGRREIVFSEMPGASQLVARTAGHKLILRNPREKSLFFDLKADPLEMENLYGRPECQAEVERLSKAIEEWRGPAGPTRAYLDENAPVINQPNVPKRDDNHRQEMIAYFQRKLGLAPGKQ